MPPGKAIILRSSEILVMYAFHIGLFSMDIIMFDIGNLDLVYLMVLLRIVVNDKIDAYFRVG